MGGSVSPLLQFISRYEVVSATWCSGKSQCAVDKEGSHEGPAVLHGEKQGHIFRISTMFSVHSFPCRFFFSCESFFCPVAILVPIHFQLWGVSTPKIQHCAACFMRNLRHAQSCSPETIHSMAALHVHCYKNSRCEPFDGRSTSRSSDP